MKSESIGDILARRLKHYGLGRAAQAAHICAVAKKLSKGEFEPVSFRSGILKISVDSSARAHLLRLKQGKIISAVNHELGRKWVERIVFKIESSTPSQ
jgi:hypothetical protein